MRLRFLYRRYLPKPFGEEVDVLESHLKTANTRFALPRTVRQFSDPNFAFEQFMTVQDRKKSGFILSPTHEEEITNLVADMTNSYKDFPLRLYQICMVSCISNQSSYLLNH